MHSKSTEVMFGFLYENFKHKFWWFEVLLMGRRILITISLTVIPDSLPMGKQFVVIILVLFLFLFLFFHPYHARDEVNSEIVSTASLLLLITTGINYQISSASWLSWVGLLVYIFTMIFLVGELIYPQLRKFTYLKKAYICCLTFLQEHFVDHDFDSDDESVDGDDEDGFLRDSLLYSHTEIELESQSPLLSGDNNREEDDL